MSQNQITILTHSDKPSTERRILLSQVPDQVKNRVINAAMLVSMAAGMCDITANEGDAEAEQLLEELQKAMTALEQYGEVTVIKPH